MKISICENIKGLLHLNFMIIYLKNSYLGFKASLVSYQQKKESKFWFTSQIYLQQTNKCVEE